MCEVLEAIGETSPSPDEDNSRMEQLMISMLEVSPQSSVIDTSRDIFCRRERSCWTS